MKTPKHQNKNSCTSSCFLDENYTFIYTHANVFTTYY